MRRRGAQPFGEGAQALPAIAIDAQLLPAYADKAVAYAKSLGKPLDRLVITHAHPDHYNGAARFGVPVHAPAQVREQIVARGDSRLPTGQVIPVTDFTPTLALVPGTEVIDGVPFVFEAVSGGEAADELLVNDIATRSLFGSGH